jgi:DNA-directed RNA polymerase subunit RPC12/RpoP
MLPSTFAPLCGDRPHDNPPESLSEPDADFVSQFRRLPQIPGNAQHPLQAALMAHDLRRRRKPLCPACSSDELKHEVVDRFQCQNCGYRILIGEDEITRPWLDWETAGRKRPSPRRLRAGQ